MGAGRLTPERRAPSPYGQKKRARTRRALEEKSRQRPTLPHGFPCSTIGSEELNFRVRDGIGCGLFEITTGNLWVSGRFVVLFVLGSTKARFGIVVSQPESCAQTLMFALEIWSSRTTY